MKNCKEVFQVTSKETAGDLMTILEAKRETRLAVWQQHIQEQRFNRAGVAYTEWLQREKLLLLVKACPGADAGASGRINPDDDESA